MKSSNVLFVLAGVIIFGLPQYAVITGLEDGAKNGNKTIYVPTEGGMPVPTLSVDK